MKKFLLTLLAIALCLAMVACDSKSKKSSKDDDDDDSSVSSEVSGESSEVSGESSEESTGTSESGKTESKSLVGTYMINSMIVEGETYSYEDIVELGGGNTCLILKADGTFEMGEEGDMTSGTYDADAKTMTAEGETIEFTVSGDTITLTDGETTIVFKK